MPPKVVTDVDEAELARQMDKLEQENEQVAGDSASDDDDDDDDSDNSEEQEGAEEKSSKGKKSTSGDLDDDPKIKAISGHMADTNLKADGDAEDDENQNWD